MYIFYVSKYITAKEFLVVENEILQKLCDVRITDRHTTSNR